MADVMQFTRELLEGKDLNMAVRGVVTHVINLEFDDPAAPDLWLIQHDTGGFLYTDVFCTRDEQLKEIQMGDELLIHQIAPGSEGSPTFLYCSSAPPLGPEQKKESVGGIEEIEQKTDQFTL